MIIAIDFDGTMVTHEFPNIGKDIGAVPVIKRLQEQGHQIILWTMRSGERLADAVNWCYGQGIDLFGINQNPEQASWSSSPKAYAQIYIDDAALGCPLITDFEISARPYVDWTIVTEMLEERGVLK